MDAATKLRATILAALPGALLGCSSTVVAVDAAPDRAPDVTASPDVPSPDVPRDAAPDAAPDVAPDASALCPMGRSSRECLTEAEAEARIRAPLGGGDMPIDAGPRDGAVPIDAARAANGCYVASAVRDGCCNPGVLVEREGDRCCYTYCTGACCGRPFTVAGRARVAPLVDDPAWCGDASTGGADLDVIARAWRDDARMEHASVASFARFTLDLLGLGAPPDMVADAQRAALDEVEHARLCFAMAARLDGRALGPGPLDVAGSLGEVSLERALVDAAREGCVGETLSALLASRRAESARDGAAREALARIARDESEHAALAWRFVAWGIARCGSEARARVRRAFDEALDEAARALPVVAADEAAWRAWGLATARDHREVTDAARREVIGPCAEALLGAARGDGGHRWGGARA